MEHADAFILDKFGANGPIWKSCQCGKRIRLGLGGTCIILMRISWKIFQTEVDMLGMMDAEALKHLQVVPIKPAITTAKRKAF